MRFDDLVIHRLAGGAAWPLSQPDQYLVGSSGDDGLTGGYGNDTLKGLAGDDYLDGGQGDDSILGGAGDDQLSAGGGNDTLIGGAGFDTAVVYVGAGTIDLSEWAPGDSAVIDGGKDFKAHLSEVERIIVYGIQDAQTMIGSAFSDSLIGSAGPNQISGGEGDDEIEGGTGSLLMGDAGDDFISMSDPDGRQGRTTVDGGEGFDTLSLVWESFEGRVRIHATKDGFEGKASGGVSFAAQDVESLSVLLDHASATIVGGSGGDYLAAIGHDGSSDFLKGGGGDDVLTGGGPRDTLLGGAGDDVIDGFNGSDAIDGGAGTDRFVYRQSGWDDAAQAVKVDASDFASDGSVMTVIDEWGGVTTISNFEGVEIRAVYGNPYLILGSEGDDAIFDSRYEDTIDAGGGDDTVHYFGGLGGDQLDSDDLYDGGSGFDTVSYIYTFGQDGVIVDLQTGTASSWKTGADTLISFEAAQGGYAGDTLMGSAAANRLEGFDGDDVLLARAGADTLNGGEGADTFVFESTGDSTLRASDLIDDLEDGDLIDLGAIDANRTAAGNQTFVIVVELDGHAGQLALSYDVAKDRTVLSGDVDGDGRADLRILISGDHTDFDNFVL